MAGRWLLAAWGLAAATLGHAVAIDMGEVRRIARQPVSGILHGTPIAGITDADYRPKVDGSRRPVIVVFYAEHDEKSRNLATLARYLAQDFSGKIGFYAYRASDAAAVDRSTSERLAKDYGVRQIPATLFYDNDRGKIELERTQYDAPTLVEYRTPSMLFFRTYYNAIHKYVTESILD
ncbi:MAG: thioredoxin family protein [Candidatus Rokuibacteriota bacterium]